LDCQDFLENFYALYQWNLSHKLWDKARNAITLKLIAPTDLLEA